MIYYTSLGRFASISHLAYRLSFSQNTSDLITRWHKSDLLVASSLRRSLSSLRAMTSSTVLNDNFNRLMNGPLDLAYHKDSGRSDTHVYQGTLGKLVIHVCSKQLAVFDGWRKGRDRERRSIRKDMRPRKRRSEKQEKG